MTHPVYSLEIDEIELAALNANSPSMLQYRAEIAAGVDPLEAIHRKIDRDEAALRRQEAAALPPAPDGLRTPVEAARKLRKPTLPSVAKQANKAAIEVARDEIKLDGTVVIVTGQGEQQQGNELDEWIAKHARAPERH